MEIQHFIINNTNKCLQIIMSNALSSEQKHQLSFEFLRISSPDIKAQTIVSHQKQVQLIAIENVAKHGYRFIFDDTHSAIYSNDFLITLIKEKAVRWEAYLSTLKNSGHSREAMIEIKQV